MGVVAVTKKGHNFLRQKRVTSSVTAPDDTNLKYDL